MDILKRVPIWVWIIGAIVLALLLFGETEVSVGNVSVGGQDLGGFEYSTGDGDSDTNSEQRTE